MGTATPPPARRFERLRRPFSALRFRAPAIAMSIFAVSLAVASILAYELLLRDGQRDIEIVIAREQQRFEQSIASLLLEEQSDDPTLGGREALERAVRRYLELNPSNDSYWTIVTFDDGRRLAASNGPPELEPLFADRSLPTGEINRRQVVSTEVGDMLTSTVPIRLEGSEVGTLQIASPLAPVRAESREAAYLVASAAGISLLLGGILLAASLWRSLTPLGTLALAARSTELRSLDARVPEPEGYDEVGLLAREFNTMLDRLDRASAQQREFMASVGHELRTPITIARGHLELLQGLNDHDPVAVEETVAILQDELHRMGRLVEDLMAIARAEMDDFTRPQPLGLVSWFEELEFKLSGLPGGQATSILPPPPATVIADPDRLAQAVLNLVTNAHRHTPSGTEVRLRAEWASDHVAVIVEDAGPGIPEAIRSEMFAPFVRSGDAPSSTGLGLSVVKAVIDAHDGAIRVETSERGTRIRLELPWHAADDGLTHGPREHDTAEFPVADDALRTTQDPAPSSQDPFPTSPRIG
jgi:two-component system, OmpR family, sensor kinase